MGAFNGRLGLKQWFGVPAGSVISLLVALPSGVLMVLVETAWMEIAMALIGSAATVSCIVLLVLGEQIIWLPARMAHMREARQPTLERPHALRE